jgi:hypothetical protein
MCPHCSWHKTHPAVFVGAHDVQKLLAEALGEELLKAGISVKIDDQASNLADQISKDDDIQQEEE